MRSITAIVSNKMWVFFLVIVLCALPLLIAHHIPLVDYPFHLARMHILHYQPTDDFLQKVYEVSFIPLPNLAMDAVVSLLSKVFPVELASKLFIIFTMVLIVSGVGVLYRTLHGRVSNVNVLLGAVLFYNWIFIFGFVNYLFGIGILLYSMAIWFSLIEHPPYTRIAVGILLSVILFFAHLVVFVLFVVILFGIALDNSLSGWHLKVRKFLKETSILAAVCVVPVAFYLFWSPTSQDIEDGFHFGDWEHKIEGLFLTPLSASPVGDAAMGAAILLLTFFAIWRGRMSMASSMRIVLALVAVVFVLSPVGSKAGWHLDDRIPLVILLLVVAATRIELPVVMGTRIVVAILAAAFILRSLLTTMDWVVWDGVYERSRQAFATLDTPAMLFVAARPEGSSRRNLIAHYRSIRPARRHIGAYAGLEPDVFVPMIHATPYLQPIRTTADVAAFSKIQRYDPIVIRDPTELVELIDEIRRLTSDLPPFIEHVYLYVRDEGLWTTDFLSDVVSVVRESDFMMVRVR